MALQTFNYNRHSIDKKDINEVTKVLKSDFITQGKQNEIFKKLINKKFKSKYCIFLNSASTALYVACRALGLKKKDVLWTSANTYAASANCGLMCNAKIDFVDISLNSFNLSAKILELKLKKTKKKNRPKILVLVHFGGNPCELKKIKKLSLKYNFKIIEDASHAIGSKYEGELIGSSKYSDATIFSFHAIKNITTGEGGAILTKLKSVSNYSETFINNGIKKLKTTKINDYYDQVDCGLNLRICDIQLSLGISQLKKLNKFISYRNKLANFYRKNLDKRCINFQKINENSKSAYHLFPIIFKTNKIRNKVYFELKKKNINCKILYPPLNNQSVFKKKFPKLDKCENANNYYSRMLSLPLHYEIKLKDIKMIINSFNKCLKK